MTTGVLVLHGLGGTPQTVGPLVEALAAAGHTVEAPCLPGHGTSIDDLARTRWADWAAAVEAAHAELNARVDRVVVAGQSLGGALACWLAARHAEIAGIVCINPNVALPDPALVDLVQAMVDAGETIAPGGGSDIADPDAEEQAYDGVPLACLQSLFEGLVALQDDLPRITCPVLVMTSPDDHVVDPANSDHLAGAVNGPVERVTLPRSYHVATLDHDKDLVAERTLDFVAGVTAASVR